MTVLTPTKDDGAVTNGTEVIYTEPGRRLTEEMLPPMLVASDLNAQFVTDLLSAVLTHERCGTHLYRSVGGRTHNPMLQGKYSEFGEETERHAALCEQLITTLGGNPNYVSPMARAVQGMDTKLLESTFLTSGGLDLMTQETAMLDAVILAETVDQGHWQLMEKLRDDLSEGELRDAFSVAVDEVGPQEDEHLLWATTTKERMVTMQAKSSAVMAMGMEGRGDGGHHRGLVQGLTTGARVSR